MEMQDRTVQKIGTVNTALTDPESILVVGASNDLEKPGGKVLNNLMNGHFRGSLRALNPGKKEVQGMACFQKVDDIPPTDLAILAIAAKNCPDVVEQLAEEKGVKAFIVLSGGFEEEGEEGKRLQEAMVDSVVKNDACLIGPNCIGLLNKNYQGVFTSPVPQWESQGCDLVSSSGATAVFLMESGLVRGMKFSDVYSVGNSAHIGIEEVLEYQDMHFDPESSSRAKLLYMEELRDPSKFYRHASSLVKKGCRIAAIKSGVSSAGSRAASSHTGAVATPDLAIRALFRKAGVVYCSGREELITVGSAFLHPPLQGKKFAVITHAGGSAVMLTDALEKEGLEVPPFSSEQETVLKKHLYPGSSVKNPIDILATGTAEQLGIMLDHCENELDNIDAVVVVFGSPGLGSVKEAYELLGKKIKEGPKPIFPVFPSVINAEKEMQEFSPNGGPFYTDEVVLAMGLGAIANTPPPEPLNIAPPSMDNALIRSVLENEGKGYLPPSAGNQLLKAAMIPVVEETVFTTEKELLEQTETIRPPWVLKVVGPLHKSDVGGVRLGIETPTDLREEFHKMMAIPDSKGVLLQPMVTGAELFLGMKRMEPVGPVLFFGLGGIYVELMKDLRASLAPLNQNEAHSLIRNSNAWDVIKGYRGREGVDEGKLVDLLIRFGALVFQNPEIQEIDLNPVMGNSKELWVVDHRIKVG